MIYCKHSIRSLLTSMLRKASIQYPSDVYALSFKKYKGEFLKDKNVLLCTRLYKYAPNLESLLTQQYVCVMCTGVFTRFHSVKNANTQLIWSSDYEVHFNNRFCQFYTTYMAFIHIQSTFVCIYWLM
jgi:hypothetical protein